VLLCAALLAACGGDDAPDEPTTFERWMQSQTAGQWRATGDEAVEVWVCRVPADTTSPVYGDLPLRAPIAAPTLAGLFQQQVSRYFHRISHTAYTPSFVAGGEVAMAAADGPDECVSAALDRASAEADVVLAVADAEHVEGEAGGKGSGGDPTETDAAARTTRRYAYVGAADFDRATWGDTPPMDLVEHELGHALGFVHSAVVGDDYLSALDLMSNSAAPRDTLPDRRDAPDVIALHRVTAGWLTDDDITQAGPDGVTVTLLPSTGDDGTRLLVLPVDATSFLTVELLVPEGYDDHLPEAGLAVHVVTLSSDDPADVVVDVARELGVTPFTDLLGPGDRAKVGEWLIVVAPDGAVTATPAP
jgi:hypothetical protein